MCSILWAMAKSVYIVGGSAPQESYSAGQQIQGEVLERGCMGPLSALSSHRAHSCRHPCNYPKKKCVFLPYPTPTVEFLWVVAQLGCPRPACGRGLSGRCTQAGLWPRCACWTTRGCGRTHGVEDPPCQRTNGHQADSRSFSHKDTGLGCCFVFISKVGVVLVGKSHSVTRKGGSLEVGSGVGLTLIEYAQ